MGTRSVIAYKDNNKSKAVINSVYCHWDGGLEHNGRILFYHYPHLQDVITLVSHGRISSLGPLIGEKHSFDARTHDKDSQTYGNTTFYARDRDEPLETEKCFGIPALKRVARGCGAEYIYVYLPIKGDDNNAKENWFYAYRGSCSFGLGSGESFSDLLPLYKYV